MANSLTASGLVVSTQQELVAFYTAQFQAIYGADINLDPSTPDGQLMMTFIQSVLDLEDLMVQINNQFDPDLAIGVQLDQRCAINGIQRQAGTHTVTQISLTISQPVNLPGLDQSVSTPYTVSDNQGNRWILQTSVVVSSPGVYSYSFQAENPGAVLSVPNTITVPVTIVLGVTAINNPNNYTSLGINEETDAELRIRRQKSVAISSQGYLSGLVAALENIPGVTFVQVYENTTALTDADGIPSHSIWVIVAGTGTVTSIADAIYRKRNAGCGMKGDQTYNITQIDGTNFVIRWDDVETEDLFIKFTATSLDGINPPNVSAIRTGLVNSFIPGVNQEVNVNALATAVQAIDPNTLVTGAGFSTTLGGSYTNTLNPATKKNQFVLSSVNIQIIPIVINPASGTAHATNTIAFSALGGYGTYTWTLNTNVSGGTINSSTGLYTAGPTPGTDIIRVTDSNSNHTDANVVVS